MAYALQQLINGITLGSIYGLIAIGYTMVFGIIGMVNFAHGDVFMLSAFIALLVVPALDHRLSWSRMSAAGALAGDVMVLLGWLGIFLVFRENSFGSATIELAPGQTVVSTGPYAWVRHPMYAAALVMLAGIPISLGSWWGLSILAAIMPALIWRLLDEERFLAGNLPGYPEYQGRVRYRLIPRIW